MKIHIDIDCFFVSAARLKDPSLEHKAVAIGGLKVILRSSAKMQKNRLLTLKIQVHLSQLFTRLMKKAMMT